MDINTDIRILIRILICILIKVWIISDDVFRECPLRSIWQSWWWILVGDRVNAWSPITIVMVITIIIMNLPWIIFFFINSAHGASQCFLMVILPWVFLLPWLYSPKISRTPVFLLEKPRYGRGPVGPVHFHGVQKRPMEGFNALQKFYFSLLILHTGCLGVLLWSFCLGSSYYHDFTALKHQKLQFSIGKTEVRSRSLWDPSPPRGPKTTHGVL